MLSPSSPFSILPQHASIAESEEKVILQVSAENAVVTVNGEPVQSSIALTNGDRLALCLIFRLESALLKLAACLISF